MPDAIRSEFLAEVDAIPGKLPKLPQRAEEADQHWSSVLQHHPSSQHRGSLRGLYRVVYRVGSALAHVTPMGLHPLVAEIQPGVLVIGHEMPPIDEVNSFTVAPVILATGLVIAAEVFGSFSIDDLNDIFDDTF